MLSISPNDCLNDLIPAFIIFEVICNNWRIGEHCSGSDDGCPKFYMFFNDLISRFFSSQATGTALAAVINTLSTLVLCLIVGFIYGWKLALVVAMFIPVLVLVGLAQTKMLAGHAQINQKSQEQAGKVQL